MSPAWMLQAVLAGALLGAAALAAERVAGWLRVPRRGVWAAAMLGSLALPGLSLLAPGLLPDLGIVPRPPAPAAGTAAGLPPLSTDLPGVADGAEPGARFHVDLSVALGLAWLATSLAVLGAMTSTYARLRTARAGWVRMEVDGFPVLVADRTGPAVVGLVHPTVVLPRAMLDLPPAERRLVLLHEREHLAAGDAWLLFLGALVVVAMPWSLPLWRQHRRLRLAVETDCDARVLARGASPRDYGRVLIRTAGSTPGLPLPGPAWGDSTSQLERRIMTMTSRRPSRPLLRSLPLLGVAAVLAAAACDLAGEGGPATPPEPAVSLSVGEVPPRATTYTTVRVDTVVSRPLDAPPTSSTGLLPAVPVRLDMTVAPPRVRTVEHFKVGEMRPGGGAWRAGLRVGDVILTVNGLDSRELETWTPLHYQRPSTPYVLRVRRGSKELVVTATLDAPGLPGRGAR